MKKVIKKKEEIVEAPEVPIVETPKIAPLTLSFGNEDLNKLVEKINEIIQHGN